jgi:coenzyme PQQ synthesis protein D (PqqD)
MMSKHHPSADVLAAHLEGEAVLLDLASGTYFGMNGVATRAWEIITSAEAGGATLAEIEATLLAEYDVSADVLATDLARLVEELRARKLVQVVD